MLAKRARPARRELLSTERLLADLLGGPSPRTYPSSVLIALRELDAARAGRPLAVDEA